MGEWELVSGGAGWIGDTRDTQEASSVDVLRSAESSRELLLHREASRKHYWVKHTGHGRKGSISTVLPLPSKIPELYYDINSMSIMSTLHGAANQSQTVSCISSEKHKYISTTLRIITNPVIFITLTGTDKIPTRHLQLDLVRACS